MEKSRRASAGVPKKVSSEPFFLRSNEDGEYKPGPYPQAIGVLVRVDKGDLRQRVTSEPKELDFCAEFRIDSQSFTPEASGQIDVRVQPDRLGIKWAGESLWTWIEWHEVLVVLGRSQNQNAAEVIAEERELAYEEGLAAGLREVFDKKVLEKAATIHLLNRSKLRQMPPPDGPA